jgi:hypothetical protein
MASSRRGLRNRAESGRPEDDETCIVGRCSARRQSVILSPHFVGGSAVHGEGRPMRSQKSLTKETLRKPRQKYGRHFTGASRGSREEGRRRMARHVTRVKTILSLLLVFSLLPLLAPVKCLSLLRDSVPPWWKMLVGQWEPSFVVSRTTTNGKMHSTLSGHRLLGGKT